MTYMQERGANISDCRNLSAGESSAGTVENLRLGVSLRLRHS
jgi:hypothetical protein